MLFMLNLCQRRATRRVMLLLIGVVVTTNGGSLGERLSRVVQSKRQTPSFYREVRQGGRTLPCH